MNKNYIDCGYFVCRHISDALLKNHNNIALDVKNTQLLYSFLCDHKLTTIFGSVISTDSYGCEKIISDTKLLTLRQLKRNAECAYISRIFESEGIPHIIQKGTAIQKFYPENVIRDSADIDMYVPSGFIKSASDALESNGYTKEKVNQENEYCFLKKPRYYVELHTKLSGFNDKQKAVFNSIAEKTISQDTHTMSDSDSYICTLFHLYKHLVLSGAGVRMFLDIYLMKQNAELDNLYVSGTLTELGLLGFEQAISDINAVLFEQKEPDIKFKEVIEFVFESGIYGTSEKHNNLQKINGTAIDKTKKQRFVESNGISFCAMSKRYPVLKKAPVLYPLSFVHRFFYGIANRRSSLKQAQKINNSISQDKVNQYKNIFETLHIDTD